MTAIVVFDLLKKGEKVIIWCTFKDNLRVFKEEIFPGEDPIIISGDVPKDPPPGYTGKIISVKINRYINLEENLNMGVYANRSIFFDYYDITIN